MKQKYFSILLFLFTIHLSFSQTIVDDFEDGNLTGWIEGVPGHWTNSSSSPITGSRSLKHNLSSVESESYIYHDISALDLSNENTTWQFNLANGSWDPSGDNKFWVYLTANETDLSSSTVDGYAVGVNLTGTNDILTLWKVTDGSADGAIITSSFDWGSGDTIGIRVTRTSTGTWELLIDSNGGFDALVSAGTGVNTDYTHDGNFGLFFDYTSTRAGLLRMDDVLVDGATPSSNPTVAFDTTLSSETETDVTFATSGIPITLSNYNADVTVTATVNGSSTAESGDYTLDLTPLTFDTNETLLLPLSINDDSDFDDESIIINIAVTSGTADLGASTHTVTIIDDELPPLIINEINADPDTSTGDANGDGTIDSGDDEFVELYNTTGSSLDISGYKLFEESTERHIFPNGTVIPSSGSIVIFGGGTVTNFTNVGGLVQVASTGSLVLTNSSGTVSITDSSENILDSYTYGSEASSDESIARSPDITGNFEQHNSIGSNPVNFSPGKDNTDNSPFIKTWTGATNNDWATASNWLESDIPGSSDNIIISDGLTNYPNFNSAVTVNSMIIEDGATFISTASFTGDVTLQKDISATQWTFVSSPVINETYNNDWVSANSVASGSGNNRGVSTWNNNVDDPTTGHWRYLQAGNSGTFNTGQGYSIYLSSAATVNFQGSGVHTSSQTFGITQGNSNNFNLAGNPFTAYLNLGDFFADNGAAVINDSAIYVWNGSSYETKLSGTDAAYEIAPGQGFFVSAAADTNLTFDVNDLSHQTQIGFGRSEPKPEIRLLLNDTNQEKFARILYINGTTTGFDLGYDGKLFSGVNESFSVFSHLLANDEGDKYQIQSLPNTNYENMVIPIGIDAEAGKEITFSAEITNIPSNLEVTLEDREKNTFNTLNTENTYTVKIEETTNGIGRFYLHTKPSGVLSTNAVELENVSAYTYSDKLRIVGLEEDNISLKMYNVLGKEVLNTTFNSNGVSDLDLPKTTSGVYVITISSSKGKLNKKIIIE